MSMNNSVISNNYLYFNKYTTSDFANKLNIPWYKARMIETGEDLPSTELKVIICTLLNCSENDLYRPYIRSVNRPKHQLQPMLDKFAI